MYTAAVWIALINYLNITCFRKEGREAFLYFLEKGKVINKELLCSRFRKLNNSADKEKS